MLRIQRSANTEVVFALSGRMDEEDVAELETLLRSEADGRRIVLDLKDLTLAGRGWHQLSRALRRERHHAEKLRRIRARMDHKTTTRKLAF